MSKILRNSSSLRTQVFRSFLGALVPVFVLLFLGVEMLLVPTVRKQLVSQLQSSTTLLGNTLNASATVAIRNHLKTVAERNWEVTNQYYNLVVKGMLSEKEAKKQLRDIILQQKVGASGYVYCVSSTGVPRIHPNAYVEGRDSAQHDFVKEQMRLRSGYMEYSWQSPTDQEARGKSLYMLYFAPFDWIISASSYRSEFTTLLNPEDFREAVLSAKFGASGYAYVIDTTGTTVIHPTHHAYNIFADGSMPTDFVEHMIANKVGTIEYTWQPSPDAVAVHKIAAFDTLDDFGWIVVSAAPKREVLKPITLTRWVAYTAVLMLVLVAYFAATALSRRLTRPVEEMVEHLDQNAKLGLQKPMRIERNDELGRLGHELNRYLDLTDKQNRNIASERARYRNLFDTSPDSIMLIQGETIVDCNPTTFKMFEGEYHQIIGKSVLDLSLPTQQGGLSARDLARSAMTAALSGQMQIFEWEHLTLNGRRFVAEVRLKVFESNDSNPTIVGFVRDITEAKQQQEEITMQATFITTLLNAIPVPVFHKNKEGLYSGCNMAFAKLSGLQPEEIIGKTPFHIWPDEIAKLHHKKDMDLISNPHYTAYESKIFTKGGDIKDVFVVKDVYRNTQGEPEGLIAAFIDITEQKETARKLEEYRNHLEFMVKERTEELEAANEELSSINEELFTQREELEATLTQLQEAQSQLVASEKMASLGVLAAGVAHEINNPLNFIYGGVMGLERYVATQIPEHAQQLNPIMNAINEGAQRAARIVASLNHYTRRDDMPSMECDLHTIIDNCLLILNNDIPSEARITRSLSPLSITIKGKEGKLHQAFLNVIQNALQAIDAKGEVIISTQAHEGKCVVTIADNGCGIPEENLSRIVDPFFTTKDPGKGVGLGLSITNAVIDDHGGNIEFKSQLGKGTSVIISMPLSK